MSSGHDEHGHGHGSRFIQHHYDDAQHQFDSGKLGIWLFLAQEVLFFSALFVAYVLYRVHHPEIYSYAHQYLQVKFGAINTAVLIFSSLTAAWAVRCAQLGQRLRLIACLALTLACACTFLGIKYIEYSHKYHEHILFGRYFDPCVSSGGVELLTKNNTCAGTKTTVDWDEAGGVLKSGCFKEAELDVDPHEPGIQAECEVTEAKLEFYKPPTLSASGSHDCTATKTPYVNIVASKGDFTITGDCEGVIVKGDGNSVKIASVKHVAVQGFDNKVVAQKADIVDVGPPPPPKEGPAPTGPQNQVNVNAAITTEKPTVAPTNGEVSPDVAEHAREIAKTPIPNRCPEENPLEHEHEGKEGEAKQVEPKFPCWRVAYQPAVCKKDYGILVEYGDTEHRGRDIAIKATCKKPPAPTAAGDLLADKEQKLVLGQKAIAPVHELTTHEMHELEAAGPPPEHTNMFFTIYFAMTGLHGIHVFVGVLVFIWLLVRAIKGHFTPDYFGPIDYAALYWHIVDLIWIFLFPLLYLIH
jgi:heme/copper-type cytochrome/quinol oxidase subunit 3